MGQRLGLVMIMSRLYGTYTQKGRHDNDGNNNNHNHNHNHNNNNNNNNQGYRDRVGFQL